MAKAKRKQKARHHSTRIAMAEDCDLVEFTDNHGRDRTGIVLWHDGLYRAKLVWAEDTKELFRVYEFTVRESRSGENIR